jgi:hypothetical protein
MGRVKQQMIESEQYELARVSAQGRFQFLDEMQCNEAQANIVRNDESVTQRIAKAWVAHATINKLKHNTEKRRQAQYYFIGGAVAMLDKVPMLISLCLASGRDLESVIQR